MFFFNGRIRSAHIAPMILRDQPYTQQLGHSCIITSCLSLIIGLFLIITGVTSEIKKTTFIGVGIISLGVGVFLTTIACFYTQMKVCYRNWAYGSPVVPADLETSQTLMTATMSIVPMTMIHTPTRNAK